MLNLTSPEKQILLDALDVMCITCIKAKRPKGEIESIKSMRLKLVLYFDHYKCGESQKVIDELTRQFYKN